MRIAALGVLAGVGLAVASVPAAAQTTTRIEPRPFYGATVTMEEGVRVFRALPPHGHVIINPGNTASVGVEVGTPPYTRRGYIYSPGRSGK